MGIPVIALSCVALSEPVILKDRRIYAIEPVKNFGSARHSICHAAGFERAYCTAKDNTNIPA
jgi:hypothetical protein